MRKCKSVQKNSEKKKKCDKSLEYLATCGKKIENIQKAYQSCCHQYLIKVAWVGLRTLILVLFNLCY